LIVFLQMVRDAGEGISLNLESSDVALHRSRVRKEKETATIMMNARVA